MIVIEDKEQKGTFFWSTLSWNPGFYRFLWYRWSVLETLVLSLLKRTLSGESNVQPEEKRNKLEKGISIRSSDLSGSVVKNIQLKYSV